MKKGKFRFDLFKLTDVEERVNCLNSYSVLSGITIDVPVTVEATQAWAQNLPKRSDRKDLVLRNEQGRAIAFSGLVNISHKSGTAELYAFVDDSQQGQGTGTLLLECTLKYASQELNLRKVSLYATEGNEIAVNFYRKIGFELEGHLKKHLWHRGQLRDRYIFSMFLSNFKSEIDIYSYL